VKKQAAWILRVGPALLDILDNPSLYMSCMFFLNGIGFFQTRPRRDHPPPFKSFFRRVSPLRNPFFPQQILAFPANSLFVTLGMTPTGVARFLVSSMPRIRSASSTLFHPRGWLTLNMCVVIILSYIDFFPCSPPPIDYGHWSLMVDAYTWLPRTFSHAGVTLPRPPSLAGGCKTLPSNSKCIFFWAWYFFTERVPSPSYDRWFWIWPRNGSQSLSFLTSPDCI